MVGLPYIALISIKFLLFQTLPTAHLGRASLSDHYWSSQSPPKISKGSRVSKPHCVRMNLRITEAGWGLYLSSEEEITLNSGGGQGGN